MGSRTKTRISLQLAELTGLACRLLEHRQDAPLRLRLYHDVFAYPASSSPVRSARRQLITSPAAKQIASQQREDGGWGRFHSADSTAHQALPTTEFAVRRAIALGLPARSLILSRAKSHAEALLAGRVAFPDPPERNDRWDTGWHLFVASTLSLISPHSPALHPILRLWQSILQEAFSTGAYDPRAEASAHRRFTGATIQGTYLELNNRYAVELMAANARRIPDPQRLGYAESLVTSPTGIRYLGVPLARRELLKTPGQFDRWLVSWDLLSRFAGWQRHASSMVSWLWSHRTKEGMWDFGPRPIPLHVLPLSNDWRAPWKRQADWSARVLSLLVQYLMPDQADSRLPNNSLKPTRLAGE